MRWPHSMQQLLDRFEQNMRRVENLVTLYTPAGQGRQPLNQTDLLRAAIVMLHASLEDFLRELQLFTLRDASREALARYSLPGRGGKDVVKFTVADLSDYQDLKVIELIEKSAREYHMNHSTFNSGAQVVGALQNAGIDRLRIDLLPINIIDEMTKRRHNIVHHADRNQESKGRGHHRVQTIKPATVTMYVQAVRQLKNAVKQQFSEPT